MVRPSSRALARGICINHRLKSLKSVTDKSHVTAALGSLAWIPRGVVVLWHILEDILMRLHTSRDTWVGLIHQFMLKTALSAMRASVTKVVTKLEEVNKVGPVTIL